MHYSKRTEPWVQGKKITVEVPLEVHAELVKKINAENSNIRKKLLDLLKEYLNAN